MTATKEASSLTPKQTEVMDLLKRGRSVPQVAKAMKISQSGVYGHIRRIQEAGHSIARENGKGRESAATNGKGQPDGSEGRPALGGSVDVPTVIRSQIEHAKSAILDIEQEAKGMSERAKELNTRKEQLQATVERHEKALTAYDISMR